MAEGSIDGHTFPGGERAIAHWENFLLTEATGGEQMPAGLAHPIHLFHVPIEGAGVTIAQLFALVAAEGPDRVGLAGYDWEWFEPLREDVPYRCDGEVRSFATAAPSDGGEPFDELIFAIELQAGGRTVAGSPTPGTSGGHRDRPGDEIPPWVMPSVLPERMRISAAILRDPNPVHWDPASTKSRGLDGRVINQGPLNVGYLVNMLMAWQGPTCLRRLQTNFAGRVLDGEHIVARGVVTEVEGDAATCEVWLERPTAPGRSPASPWSPSTQWSDAPSGRRLTPVPTRLHRCRVVRDLAQIGFEPHAVIGDPLHWLELDDHPPRRVDPPDELGPLGLGFALAGGQCRVEPRPHSIVVVHDGQRLGRRGDIAAEPRAFR